jgi:hypothetical protein
MIEWIISWIFTTPVFSSSIKDALTEDRQFSSKYYHARFSMLDNKAEKAVNLPENQRGRVQ